MYCPDCGTPCREGAKFCPNCGSTLNEGFTPAGVVDPTPPEAIQPMSLPAKGGRSRAVWVILALALAAVIAWKLSTFFAGHPDVRGSWSGSVHVSAMGMTAAMPINLNIQEESKGGALKGTLDFEGQHIPARGQVSGEEVAIRADLQSAALGAFGGNSSYPLTLKGDLQGDHIQGNGHLEFPVNGAFEIGSFDLQRPAGSKPALGTTAGSPAASGSSNAGVSSAHSNPPPNPDHLPSISVHSPSQDVVIRGEQKLSQDLLCRNLTVASGATLVTLGHSIICSGDFANFGVVVTGWVANGGNGEGAQGGSEPNSYGGSGGGGEGGGGLWGARGGSTRVPGGGGGPNNGNGQDGKRAQTPPLNTRLLREWYERGLSSFLSGAGGGVNGGGVWERGGNGAYGLYVQAHKIVAGEIDARGENGRGQAPSLPSNGAGSGGGGGGVIILAYGFGGYVAGRSDVSGGNGSPGWGSGGGGRGGRGGDGQVLASSFGSAPPITGEVSAPTATAQPSATPSISHVNFELAGQILRIEVEGSGFGGEPRSMPFTGDLPCFAFNNLGHFEAGSSRGGDAVTLNFLAWNDRQIVAEGFYGAYGQGAWWFHPGAPILITVQNPSSGKSAQWQGLLPPDVALNLSMQANNSDTDTPVINDVVFSNEGRDLVILVRGRGFGAPPRTLPYEGDLPYFAFNDEQSGWQAGNSPDGNLVGLKYRLWMPSAIIIKGFSGAYGRGSWVVRSGDRVSITVWNPSSHQKAEWHGTLP